MNAAQGPVPIEKNVVLVGAGNAHVVFVKRFAMKPIPGVAITLVNEAGDIPYSAMVPGHIAGDYSWEEISIDLVRLCAWAKVRFVSERVQSIDRNSRQVRFASRPPLVYDALSLGLGSVPACPTGLGCTDRSLVMRPLAGLVNRLGDIEKQVASSPNGFHFVVVGGGASGCELALAIHRRLAKNSAFRMTLLQGNNQLLPQYPEKAARLMQETLQQRGITVRLNARAASGTEIELLLENGERVPFDLVLWATNASPPALLGQTGVKLDAGGFMPVHDTLQSVTDSAIFGAGDCVAFVSRPDLPRNGVYAVRQGAVLFENIPAFLREKPLEPFQPQNVYLSLLNTGDGAALLTYGSLVLKNRMARKLKDRIDRRWIEKFIPPPVPPAASGDESYQMRCGGCGSKVSGDVLSAALRRIEIPDDPRVLMGTRTGEDAAVHRMRPELFGTNPEKLVEVQTVDFFKAFVDDPYFFGRIAALNSVSDIYAMNARPFSALAIATLPYARGPVQEAMLYELLTGAVTSLKELGVVLTGGHTTEGPELALGFAVTGYGEEDRLFQKSKLRPGDKLILTKPLGSGAILAAWMRGACRASWFARLTETMLLTNARAGQIFSGAGVQACTDVTGFGLAGHMLEMIDASGVAVGIEVGAVPIYRGFNEVVAAGIVSTLQRDNAKVACRVEGAAIPAWLFDPQTSGGLLGAVRPEVVEETLVKLREADYREAAVIGEVLKPGEGGAAGIVLR